MSLQWSQSGLVVATVPESGPGQGFLPLKGRFSFHSWVFQIKNNKDNKDLAPHWHISQKLSDPKPTLQLPNFHFLHQVVYTFTPHNTHKHTHTHLTADQIPALCN